MINKMIEDRIKRLERKIKAIEKLNTRILDILEKLVKRRLW